MIPLVSLALAAPPPSVDPNDIDHWASGAERVLAGPEGCWELSGRIELVVAGYVPASRWTSSGRHDHRNVGTFAGRLEGGTWTRFEVETAPAGDDDYDLSLPVYPMVGKIDPEKVVRAKPDDAEVSSRGTLSVQAGSGDAVNTLQRLLDELDPETATSYAEWSDALGAVRLFEDFPLPDAGRDVVTVTTTFPGGGAATALDAVFPRRVKVGDGLVKATVFDAQLHLRGQVVDGATLPALESLSAGIAVLGFTLGYEQKLTYERATRCGP